VIADVSGKGMPAALFMAATRSVIRAKATALLSPAEIFIQANALICADAARGMYVTVFYVEIDPGKRLLTYVNCGHNSPFWYKAREKDISELPSTGSVVGINSSLQWEQKQIQIEKGDVIVLYTDGITEGFNEEEQEFGDERLKAILNANAHKSPAEILTEIQASLNTFVGSAPQSDDRTIVIIKSL
jgi:sigma-B regulation protein RsbU (phosphoserine phosphatase)